MSDYKPRIYTNFLSRSTGKVISAIPVVNRITISKDIRQFTDTFDFDILFHLNENIEIHSHDFVEFYIKVDGINFQICCGFVEDFVKETTGNSHRFQANGRDFLGQLFSLNFITAKPVDQTTLINFVNFCITNSYLQKYQDYKGITNRVLDQGAYKGGLTVRQLSDAKMAPILQQNAEEVYNIIYQNRHGQAVVWGSSFDKDIVVDQTITDTNNINVERFVLRENYSKVFSEVKVFYVGSEGNIPYGSTPSLALKNSEPKAQQIYQPEIRTFQNSNLVTTQGKISYGDAKDLLAKSIIRRSNQNLAQVVIKAVLPYYISNRGVKIPYEVNQIWRVRSVGNKIDAPMRLASVHYTQTDSSFDVELLFIGKETLI